MTQRDSLQLTKLAHEAAPLHECGQAAVGLPLSLLRKASRRLQLVSLFLTVVVGVGWLGGNFLEGELLQELRSPADYVPNVTILAASLLVFALARRSSLRPETIVVIGLAYQVVVSWCIPITHYWGAFRGLPGERLSSDLVGMSSVALWMVWFTVLMPAQPRHAMVALLLSSAAVPSTMAVLTAMGDAPRIAPMDFAFIFIVPYLITAVLAYFAARIIYGLSQEVRRARELGSYRLLELIGRGGMGEVWKAQHNVLARPAAIKLIQPDAVGGDQGTLLELSSRFEREAQVTAELESPHTVELYDFGVSEDGSFYYVMELLDGEDLDSLIRRTGPLPAERVVHILNQVCRSLDEAHRRGLIHRDIKPANIFLCERAFEPDFVKVLDFGLVQRSSNLERGADPTVPQQQMVAGTPAYIAPELALGVEVIDGRADLYSLGCVAFWLLTGRPPFEEQNPVALIVAHTNAPAPAPSACTKAPIPSALDALVQSCLAKDPADRPASAEHLARELTVLGAESPWTREQADRWWGHHRPGGRPE